jgi:hypothetical protein
VYHNYPLAPLLELAVSAIQDEVIGFYYANESTKDIEIPTYITRIEKSIIARKGSCIVMQIKNSAIDDASVHCLQVSR